MRIGPKRRHLSTNNSASIEVTGSFSLLHTVIKRNTNGFMIFGVDGFVDGLGGDEGKAGDEQEQLHGGV